MQAITKITTDGDEQFFQKYSRKDLKEIIEVFFDELNDCDTKEDLEYHFEDSGLFWELDDGTSGSLDENGLDGKRPAVSRITKLYEDGYGTYVGFFGKGISPEFNENYGDWEVNM